MLVELNLTLYEPFVINHKGNKVLYVQMLMALYGMLIASLLLCVVLVLLMLLVC